MNKYAICAFAAVFALLSTAAAAGEPGFGGRESDQARIEEAEQRLRAEQERRRSIERDGRQKPRVTIGGEINTRLYSRSGTYEGPDFGSR